MSAWMVSKTHIDLIVATAFRGPKNAPRGWSQMRPYFADHQLSVEALDRLGEELVKENLSSIHSRYPDTVSNPEGVPGPIAQYWLEEYIFPDSTPALTAVEALKALDCYEYQSCEHPEWEQSIAFKFCSSLRHALISTLPGYESAPWGFDKYPVAV